MTRNENRRLRKALELIQWLLKEVDLKNNLGAVHDRRDTFHHIFFNGDRLDELFLYIFPVDRIEEISRMLNILKSVCGSGNNEVNSYYSTRIKKDNLISLLNEVRQYIEQAIAEHGFNIFYSWQSDLPNNTNRNFIEKSLEKAISEVNNEQAIALKLDKDTVDRTGSPDIVQTIFEKIEDCFIFVADISIISKSEDTNKKVLNPNVLLELGYAQGVLGTENIIMLFNTATGDLEDLPFDLRGKRIMQYCCDESTESNQKKCVKEDLIKNLKRAITLRVKSEIR